MRLGHTHYFSDAAGDVLDPTELAERQEDERRKTLVTTMVNDCYDDAEERTARNAGPPPITPSAKPAPKRRSQEEERKGGTTDVRKRQKKYVYEEEDTYSREPATAWRGHDDDGDKDDGWNRCLGREVLLEQWRTPGRKLALESSIGYVVSNSLLGRQCNVHTAERQHR